MPVARVVYGEGGSDYAQFVRIENQPQDQGLRVELFTRPGINGVGALKVGKRGEPFQLVGFRDFEDCADASADLTALIAALSGVVCSIYDNGGIEHADMLCVGVRPGKPVPVLAGTGGLSTNFGAVATVIMEFVHVGA